MKRDARCSLSRRLFRQCPRVKESTILLVLGKEATLRVRLNSSVGLLRAAVFVPMRGDELIAQYPSPAPYRYFSRAFGFGLVLAGRL